MLNDKIEYNGEMLAMYAIARRNGLKLDTLKKNMSRWEIFIKLLNLA